jgi:hypothetical protein
MEYISFWCQHEAPKCTPFVDCQNLQHSSWFYECKALTSCPILQCSHAILSFIIWSCAPIWHYPGKPHCLVAALQSIGCHIMTSLKPVVELFKISGLWNIFHKNREISILTMKKTPPARLTLLQEATSGLWKLRKTLTISTNASNSKMT